MFEKKNEPGLLYGYGSEAIYAEEGSPTGICTDCKHFSKLSCTKYINIATGLGAPVTLCRSQKEMCGPLGRLYEKKIVDVREYAKNIIEGES